MESYDRSIDIKLIYYPYYTATFNEVPNNPFSIMLFAYLGEISPILYNNNLEKFKKTLNEINENFKKEKESSYGSNGKNNFTKYVIESYPFYDRKSNKWIANLIEDVQKEKYFNEDIYEIVSKYFNLSYFISDKGMELYNILRNNNNNNPILNEDTISASSREIYFLFDEEKVPLNILKQDTNGNIRCHSLRL